MMMVSWAMLQVLGPPDLGPAVRPSGLCTGVGVLCRILPRRCTLHVTDYLVVIDLVDVGRIVGLGGAEREPPAPGSKRIPVLPVLHVH